MTPARLRLLSLVALAIPVALTAVAAPATPAFPALALATAAAGAALLLAGRLFRVILAVLIAALGIVVVLVAVTTPATVVLTDTQALGSDLRTWLVLALVGGILQIIIGIGIAATSRGWPASTSRYSRTRTTGGDAIDDWDALSAGDDPTDIR